MRQARRLDYHVTLLASANHAPPPVSTNSSPGTIVFAIAVVSAGDALITGWTADPNFPATPGAFQSQPNFTVPANNPFVIPPWDAFVAGLQNPSGTAYDLGEFSGGTGHGRCARASRWMRRTTSARSQSTTQSADFPATSGFQLGGGEFVVELFNAAGSALTYAAAFPVGLRFKPVWRSMLTARCISLAPRGWILDAHARQLERPPLHRGQRGLRPNGRSRRLVGSNLEAHGLHLGVSTPVPATFNSAGFLPETLGGIRVTTIGGVAAPTTLRSGYRRSTPSRRRRSQWVRRSPCRLSNGAAYPCRRFRMLAGGRSHPGGVFLDPKWNQRPQSIKGWHCEFGVEPGCAKRLDCFRVPGDRRGLCPRCRWPDGDRRAADLLLRDLR